MAFGGALANEGRTAGPNSPTHREEVMLISEVAAVVGLEPKTIRFYERVQLVAPEKHGRIRIFRSGDIARLQGIKKLRQYGLPIAAIRKILRSEGDLTLETVRSPNVQKLMALHLEEMKLKSAFMNEQIADLKSQLDLQPSTDDHLAERRPEVPVG